MILNEGINVKMGADNTSLLRAFSQSSGAAKAFAGVAVGALAAITAQSVKMAAQLDKDLRLVATLGGGAAGNIGQLRQEIQGLGREFGQNFNELARANYQAVSGGFKDIKTSMELTRAGTKLAIAGNADLVGSTEGVVKWMKAFSEENLAADDAAAQLWGTTRDGIVTVEQLNRFLADLPATMGQSGIKSYELVAALSTLTGVTGNAGRAVDQLRSLVIKMEQEGFSGSLLQRIQNFNDKGLGELVTLLGDQTAATGAQVLASNMETLAANVSGAQKVTDDFNTAVQTMNDSSLSEWNRLQANVNSLMSDLGSRLMPVVNAALREMNGLLTPQTTAGGQSVAEWATGQVARRNAMDAFFADGGRNPLSDVPYSLPDSYYRPMAEGGMPIAINPFADPRAERDEMRRYGYQGAGMFGENRAPEAPFRDFRITGNNTGQADYITGIAEFGEVARESSAMAAASAGILSGAIGGLLVSAFVTAESATGRFVQGLLAQFAQLGIQKGISSLFGLPGFASGGFTGNSGGLVHAGEFVFNSQAVQSVGLGRLERQHNIAQSGGAEITINQTVNGGDPSEVSRVTAAAVGNAWRELQSTGKNRLYKSGAARWGR